MTSNKQIQAARRAPAMPVQKGDYLDGVNIPRLREALTFLGRGNGVGEGEVANKLSEYVNAIVRAVLASKELLRSGAPAVPVISEATVLAITTAYEQGVGKGHQSHARKEAITNPYSDEWGCDSAWQMGYDEGREQAERKAAAPQPPEADHIPDAGKMVAVPVQLPEPVYTMRVRGRMHDYTPTLSAFDLADGEHALYTEQQVRQLLEAHGIEVAP